MKTAAIALVGLLAGGVIHGEEPPPRFSVAAALLSEAPTIDGRLEEEVWQEAALLDHFTQLLPEEGAPASERTEVRIGYDERTLYIAARCYESQPEKITAVVMDRDGTLANDDSLRIVLDTFSDRRNAFLFEVNPLGAQGDALVRDEGDEINTGWDGVWGAAASRDEEGWSVEIAIPFRTLRFPRQEVQSWGLNIQRNIVYKRESVLWRPVPRYSVNEALFKLSQAGELTGLAGLVQGRSFDVKPYLIVRAEDNATGEEGTFDAGVDVKKNLTSNLVLDLTYNLDFAEAEVDEQQVNLTRFPLFFPEKRDFFLEGANLFYFGERPDPIKRPDKIFFFSRRIGLTEDGLTEIPVIGGAKISGTLGRLGIGFLNLTLDDLDYRDREGRERFEPRTNYTVLRLKQRLFGQSSVGLMWLDKQVSGGRDNRGVGVDWDFAAGKSFKTGGFLAQTSTDGLDGDDWAGMVDAVWQSKQLFVKSVYSEIGEDFNPEMGFVTRLGVRDWRTHVTYDFHPKKGKLRDIYVFGDSTYITDRDGNLESRVHRLESDLLWRNISGAVFKIFDHTEVLEAPFEISRGVIIPPGEYGFVNYFTGFQTSPGKPVFHYNQFSFGEFYDGDFFRGLLGFDIRPRAGLTIRLTYEHSDVDLPAGDFEVDLATTRVIYSFSPRLSFRLFAQWNRDDNFDLNFRCQWLYKPGAAFYVVYDELRDLSDATAGTELDDRSLITKMSFFF